VYEGLESAIRKSVVAGNRFFWLKSYRELKYRRMEKLKGKLLLLPFAKCPEPLDPCGGMVTLAVYAFRGG